MIMNSLKEKEKHAEVLLIFFFFLGGTQHTRRHRGDSCTGGTTTVTALKSWRFYILITLFTGGEWPTSGDGSISTSTSNMYSIAHF